MNSSTKLPALYLIFAQQRRQEPSVIQKDGKSNQRLIDLEIMFDSRRR